MDQKKTIVIDNPSVLKNYTHPIGGKIIKSVTDKSMSANELAELIGFPRDNIYYHIKKLVKTGLLVVSDTEIINGITKKKYITSAKYFEIAPSILPNSLKKDKSQKKGGGSLKPDTSDSPTKSIPSVQEEPLNKSERESGHAIQFRYPETSEKLTKDKTETSSPGKNNETSLRELLTHSLKKENPNKTEKNVPEPEKENVNLQKNKDDTFISLNGVQYIISNIDSESIRTTLNEDLNDIIEKCGDIIGFLNEITEEEQQKKTLINKIILETDTLMNQCIQFSESLLGKSPEQTGNISKQSEAYTNLVNEDLFREVSYFNKKIKSLIEKLIGLFSKDTDRPEKKQTEKNIEIEIRTLSNSLLEFSEMLVENMLEYIINNIKQDDGELMSLEEKTTLRDNLMEGLLIDRRTNILQMPAISPEINLKDPSLDKKDAPQEIKKKKVESKRSMEGLLLYLFRLLNGYSEILTFVKQGNKINFLQASVKLDGFKVIRLETFLLPMRFGRSQFEDLTSLILHVYNRYIPKKKWKKYYLSYFTTDYPIAVDFMNVPNMKKAETEEYIKNTISNNFSIDSNKLCADWILQRKNGTADRVAVCTFTDREKIINDYQTCIDNGIQPRFITSVPKLQYDIYRYNYDSSSSENALLIYFDYKTTWITLINSGQMVDCRQCWIGMNDFIDALGGIKFNERTISREESEEWLMRNGITQDDKDTYKDTNIILSSVFQKFISDIQKTLRHFKKKGGKDFDLVYMDGPGVEISNIVPLTSHYLEKETVHMNIDLKEIIDETDNLRVNDKDDFSENIGLLLDPRDKLNLIPEQARSNMNFLLPSRLTQIIGALCIVFSLFFIFLGYMTQQELEARLPQKITKLEIAKSNQDLYYRYLQDLTVIKGFDRVRNNDKFVSEKFVTVLKYLSDTLPEIIKLNLLDYNGENPKNLSLTFTGIIDAADYESDVILSDLKYRLEKHALFKRVEITSKKPGHENTLTFQMSIAL